MTKLQKIQGADRLRANMTHAESVLWDYLKSDRNGYTFSAQVILSGYIADFYCVETGLVIEVDGESHRDKQEADRARDANLLRLGHRTLRFDNSEVIGNVQSVLNRIDVAVGFPAVKQTSPSWRSADLMRGYMQQGYTQSQAVRAIMLGPSRKIKL